MEVVFVLIKTNGCNLEKKQIFGMILCSTPKKYILVLSQQKLTLYAYRRKLIQSIEDLALVIIIIVPGFFS